MRFVAALVAEFNGVALQTTFSSTTQLAAALPASDLTSGAIATITVSNPTPGGGVSSGAKFTVNNPSPVVSSISPASVIAGAQQQTLDIHGTGCDESIHVEQVFHGKLARISSTSLLRIRGASCPALRTGRPVTGSAIILTCCGRFFRGRQNDATGFDLSIQRITGENSEPAAEKTRKYDLAFGRNPGFHRKTILPSRSACRNQYSDGQERLL